MEGGGYRHHPPLLGVSNKSFMATTKPMTEGTEFHVALNPKNPEANSWFDPGTGTNLFLNKPESKDLSKFEVDSLRAVGRGIRSGLLIVSRGKLPDGLDVSGTKNFASPRGRWDHEDAHEEGKSEAKKAELQSAMEAAMKNHEAVVGKAS